MRLLIKAVLYWSLFLLIAWACFYLGETFNQTALPTLAQAINERQVLLSCIRYGFMVTVIAGWSCWVRLQVKRNVWDPIVLKTIGNPIYLGFACLLFEIMIVKNGLATLIDYLIN